MSFYLALRHSDKSAAQPSATQGTATGSPIGADRGQDALRCSRQLEEFIRDLNPGSDLVFL